jgi:hypothetical protein
MNTTARKPAHPALAKLSQPAAGTARLTKIPRPPATPAHSLPRPRGWPVSSGAWTSVRPPGDLLLSKLNRRHRGRN